MRLDNLDLIAKRFFNVKKVIVGLWLAAAMVPALILLVNYFNQNSEAITASSVSPNHGPMAGGTVVTIKGNFSPSVNYLADVVADNNITTLQALTPDLCGRASYDPVNSGLNSNNTVSLEDARKSQTEVTFNSYEIRKMPDGKCWMINNLRLENLTLTSNDSNVTTNYVIPSKEAESSAGPPGAGPSLPGGPGPSGPSLSSIDPKVYGPVTGDTNSDATNYGYLYNWPAATAGSGDSLTADGNVAQESICPKNWRLPRAMSGTDASSNDTSYASGDFAVLNASMQAGSLKTGSTEPSYYDNWLYAGLFKGVFSGFRNTYAGLGDQGSSGYLWSSTMDSPGFAHSMYFSSNNVSLDTFSDTSSELGVRCVVEATAPSLPTVKFGEVDATKVEMSKDGKTIKATTPSAAVPGLVDIVINNGVDEPIILPLAFTYDAPAAIANLTPKYGPETGDTDITITGSGFGQQSDGTILSLFSSGNYYVAEGTNITVYSLDGSETEVDTSALATDIVALKSDNSYGLVNVVIDEAGGLYFITPDNAELIALKDFVEDFPSGGVAAFDVMYCLSNWHDLEAYGKEYWLVSCSGVVYSKNNEPASISFNYYKTPGQVETGGSYSANQPVSCNVDAIYSDELYHCSNGDIYYHESKTDVSLLDGNFVRFLSGKYLLTDTNKIYYIGEVIGGYSGNQWQEINTSIYNVGQIVFVGSKNPLFVVDSLGDLYVVYEAEDPISGKSVKALVPYVEYSGDDMDLSTIDGLVTQFYSGYDSSSSSDKYYAVTDSGEVWITDYDHMDSNTNVFSFVKTDMVIPLAVVSQVILDVNGAPAECLIIAWSDTEIACTTSAHAPGLVGVSVVNGTYHSAEAPATCAVANTTACNGRLDSGETRNQDRTNVISGFLYEELYISVATTADVTIGGSSGITPTAAGVFASTSNSVTVTTNQSSYNLSLKTNASDNNLHHQSLSANLPSTTATSLASPGQLNSNTWGLSLSSTANPNDNAWVAVPNKDNSSLTVKSTTTGPYESGDTTNLYYGVNLNIRQLAGRYKTGVVYTAVGGI